MTTLAKRVPIPKGARIKTYYDTKEIIDSTTVLNFFPATATRDATRDNYISNPFPGEEKRRVVGMSFELIKQFIKDDPGESIDAEAIINQVKDAAIILTADNDYKEFVRTPLSNHFNFAGTGLNIRLAIAGDPAAAGESTTTVTRVVTMKSAKLHRIPDPFDIASTQSIDLQVHFADNSAFPTATQWTDSGQGRLYMRAKLYLAELRKG